MDINYRLAIIMEQLTTQQIFKSRESRNWESFDKMTLKEKMYHRLEELQIYEDDIDPNYKPKAYKK